MEKADILNWQIRWAFGRLVDLTYLATGERSRGEITLRSDWKTYRKDRALSDFAVMQALWQLVPPTYHERRDNVTEVADRIAAVMLNWFYTGFNHRQVTEANYNHQAAVTVIAWCSAEQFQLGGPPLVEVLAQVQRVRDHLAKKEHWVLGSYQEDIINSWSGKQEGVTACCALGHLGATDEEGEDEWAMGARFGMLLGAHTLFSPKISEVNDFVTQFGKGYEVYAPTSTPQSRVLAWLDNILAGKYIIFDVPGNPLRNLVKEMQQAPTIMEV